MPTQRIIKKNAKHDTDKDGVISDEEVASSKELLEIELREEKSDAQRRMAWVAISAMVVASVALYTPLVPIERVNALSGLLGGFYVAQAGIVAAYMGVSAWMGKK
jgi:hypothetical protein